MNYFEAVNSRKSIRKFLPDPVSRETVEKILTSARRAPSGGNLQPGSVHVLTGEPLMRLTARLTAAYENREEVREEFDYYPNPMPRELKERVVECGMMLYESLNIDRHDKPARRKQFGRNYVFFDAPVAMIVFIDKSLGKGCYVDLGMFVHGILLAAESLGLSTCALGSLAHYPHILRQELQVSADQIPVCGIALGYKDPAAPENQFTVPRLNLEKFAHLKGF